MKQLLAATLVLVIFAAATLARADDKPNPTGTWKLAESDQPMVLTPSSWQYALTVVAVVFCLLIVCAAAVAVVYFMKFPKEAANQSNEFLKSQSAVRLLTVLVVVAAACILSVLNALNDGAIAILSGIAGYVLGGVRTTRRSNPISSYAVQSVRRCKMTKMRNADPIGQITSFTPINGTHEKAESRVNIAVTATVAVPSFATEGFLFRLAINAGVQGYISEVTVLPGHFTHQAAAIDLMFPSSGTVDIIFGITAEGLTSGKIVSLYKATNQYPVDP